MGARRLFLLCLRGGDRLQIFGRRKIFTSVSEITADNVVDVIRSTSEVHRVNQREIQYLYNYYKGKQDILYRSKAVRPEICNTVVVNHANEIVSFKVSYLLGEPMQYVSRNDADSKEINRLNEFMYAEDKESKDKEIADWIHICGVGYQMVRPDKKGEQDGSPVNILTLDPRNTFCIYSLDTGNPLIGGVLVKENSVGDTVYVVYTPDRYFEVKDEQIISKPAANTIGLIPIVEYVHNEARLGAFEPVIPLLDKINIVESNRIDDIEQYVQSFLVFENCDIDREQYTELRKDGALKVKGESSNPAKVYRVGEELSQAGVQSVIDDLYDRVITICGMPNRNGGSSTSDTGAATIFRDGWQDAEARASDTEKLFKRSGKEFLRLVLRICSDVAQINLTLGQIAQKFPRRNNINQQSKAQTLSEMLNNPKIHPLLAFTNCGMFPDPEAAYTMSMKWYEQNKESASGKTEIVTDSQVTKTENSVQGSTVKNAESENEP